MLLNEDSAWSRIQDDIINGDINDLKFNLKIMKIDINKNFPMKAETNINNTISLDERFVLVSGPTLLIFAIMYEQFEIFKFLLNHPLIDRTKASENGVMPIHIACLIKPYIFLEELIKFDDVQTKIDEPCGLSKIPNSLSMHKPSSNAFHIACSNNRYVQVMLLIMPLPSPIDNPHAVHDPIDVNSLTTMGNSAMHIAVCNKSLTLAYILQIFHIDLTIQNSRNQRAIDLVNEKINYEYLNEWKDILNFNNFSFVQSFEILNILKSGLDPINFLNYTVYDEISELREQIQNLKKEIEYLKKQSK